MPLLLLKIFFEEANQAKSGQRYQRQTGTCAGTPSQDRKPAGDKGGKSPRFGGREDVYKMVLTLEMD